MGDSSDRANPAIRKMTNSHFSATSLRNYPADTASATITLPIETEGWNQPKQNFSKSNPIEIRSERLAAMILALAILELFAAATTAWATGRP
jgi:hypothetical protein